MGWESSSDSPAWRAAHRVRVYLSLFVLCQAALLHFVDLVCPVQLETPNKREKLPTCLVSRGTLSVGSISYLSGPSHSILGSDHAKREEALFSNRGHWLKRFYPEWLY